MKLPEKCHGTFGAQKSIKSCKTINDLRGVLADIFREIGSFKSCIDTKFEGLNNTLDSIGSKVNLVAKKIEEVEVRVIATETKVSLLEENYDLLVKRIEQLENKNLKLKIANNDLGQRERLRTVRFHNVKGKPIKGSREAMDLLYNKFLKPALVKSGDYEEIPPVRACAEYSHHLPEMPGKNSDAERDGETYIMRFRDRFMKESFFKTKKDFIDNYNAWTGEKVRVSQDYTHVNRQALYRLHQDKTVKRITVRGTRLMFKLEIADPWSEVINPFSSTTAGMTVI